MSGLNIIQRTPLLSPHKIEVLAEGELVVVKIGGTTLKIQYEDALKISQWIRVRAKEAKNNAGDKSRHWSGLAVLEGLKNFGKQ